MSAELWLAAMACGEFATAWQISDAILLRRQVQGIDCSHWPRHEQFIWNGAPFAGRRVLVRCYHGLGDTLQSIRFLPRVRTQASHVTLWVQPPLLELLRGIEGADRLLALHAGTPPVDYDIDLESMELAHAVRVTPESMPQPPYLHAIPAQRHDDGLLHIGIAWLSGSWNSRRSIAADVLAPLEQVPCVRWHSLQFGITRPPLGAAILPKQDLRSVARCMLGLDLVISVDTMTAHLAGALGAPTWTLVPTPYDWRWMLEGSETPWYPGMRLFRQREPGVWSDVIEDVQQALLETNWPALRPRCAAPSLSAPRHDTR